MPSVLLIYATTHGHTAKIAGRLGEALAAEGAEVDLRDVAETEGADTEAAAHDAVIAAASLHQERHQPEMVSWVKANREALSSLPTAFLSVSLTAAEDSEEAHEATQRCIDDFIAETGWTPGRTEAVAGALQYLEYDRFTRTLIKLMMRRGGHPTDASRDYDYTDWDALERFGREFASALPAGAESGG